MNRQTHINSDLLKHSSDRRTGMQWSTAPLQNQKTLPCILLKTPCGWLLRHLLARNSKHRAFNLITFVFLHKFPPKPLLFFQPLCRASAVSLCACFELSYQIFIWKCFFFFPSALCLAGWSCHERMMQVTNNKTDVFTEDWRAGFIFGNNLGFWRIKQWKTWCKAQIASFFSENYWLLARMW